MSYDRLTKNRKLFIEQLYNLINNQFKAQQNLKGNPNDIIKELENNPEYIQRIFIDASWGMGKTYFAEAFKELIELKKTEPKIEVITINSWETDYFSDPMKSIIGEINNKNLISIETQKIAENIIKNIFKAGSKIILKLILKKAKFNDEDIEELKSIFTGINTSELQDYKSYKALVDNFKEQLTLENNLKLIIIDELDRCKPNYAIELLETVKHFFGVKNIIFIFLVNKEQLKSIISTSYLTEDKCSEYFEKFFDIEFKLPEVEYEDFIEIEYKKYNEFSTYEPQFTNQNLDLMNYYSDKKDKFYESIFLEAFKSNCNGKNVSTRNFIKSFKKFTILLSSLSDEIKNIYPLMIILILYFIREEFLKGDKFSFPFKLLFLKTFFKNVKINLDNLLTEEEIYKKNTIKNKYFINSNFYQIFYLILFFETGKKEYIDVYYDEYTYGIYLGCKEKYSNITLQLDDKTNIIFKEINSYIVRNGTHHLTLDRNLFNHFDINEFKLDTQREIYSIELLEEWARLKYNFVLS